jgi:pimeloyl-ACP methyl ester carboxylesterase
MKSYFSSPKAKEDTLNLYHEKLDMLAVRYEFLQIETTFGDTNVILTGNMEKPPLVLLHGSNGCAPVAIEALIELLKDFRVYAIDVVGQPNLSAEVRPDMKDNSYGQWMFEILTRLNLKNVSLVGISFGGLISWKTLAFDERRISRAFLIVPAGIVNGHPLAVLSNVFFPMKMYQWRKKEKHLLRIIGALFSEPDEFARKFLGLLFMHYEMDFSPIPLIRKAEANKIKTPVYLIAAEKDVLFPGVKMLARARAIFPSLNGSLLLEKSKHVPPAADNQRIAEFIKKHAEAAT